VHDSDDQERHTEHDTVAAERLGYRERGHEHPCHRAGTAASTLSSSASKLLVSHAAIGGAQLEAAQSVTSARFR
jgi:hypothetical protein